MSPSPLPELQRIALRLEKGRYAYPREWVDPLELLGQARARAKLWPDGRPGPGENSYADAYRQLRNRIPYTAKRLRLVDLLAYDTIKATHEGRELPATLPRRTF